MNDLHNIRQRLTQRAADTKQTSISDLLADKSRLPRYSAHLDGLTVDFSKHLVDDETMSLLLELAETADIRGAAKSLAGGESLNITEDRAAMHMALRTSDEHVTDQDFAQQVRTQNARMRELSEAIRSGSYRGATGEVITDVINIGIGGSDLGPKMVCAALRQYRDGPSVHFISNVDGAEILSLLPTLNAASTLIVISSKTFTTAETLLNANTALQWLGESLAIDNPAASPHCIGITNNITQAQAFGVPRAQLLTFEDTVGGRYSLWSTIGFSICVATGFSQFQALLDGAAQMDRHFLETRVASNIPVIMALLGIWYNNFLGAETQAVIPYCQRLGLFVDHLQQLDMESNGKSATLDGELVATSTGPIIWGQTGTNGQHAFFQLLHQGTRLVPVDFIGVINDSLSKPAHHRVLLANMIAQSEALMKGAPGADRHHDYPGNRPSTTILLDQLSPRILGMLIAAYEHKVFCQAVIWQINPFDQWGVELGKQLANRILADGENPDGHGEHDASTHRLMQITGLID